MNLEVANLTYRLVIDTGSSDFFIKGDNMEGEPKIKYSCPRCKQKAYRYLANYLDGSINCYTVNTTVSLSKNISFTAQVRVGYETSSAKFKPIGGVLGLY